MELIYVLSFFFKIVEKGLAVSREINTMSQARNNYTKILDFEIYKYIYIYIDIYSRWNLMQCLFERHSSTI